MKSMQELIDSVCGERLRCDLIEIGESEIVAKLSNLGLARMMALMRRYGDFNIEIARMMTPEDQGNFIRLVSILTTDGKFDDPFERKEDKSQLD